MGTFGNSILQGLGKSIGNSGGGIINTLFNYGLGVAESHRQNEMNRQNTQDYMRWQFDYGEQAANNADARTRALYNDLYSPEAKVQQLKAAGLSPALMYSNGFAGGGSSSGAQGNGANGGIAPVASAFEAAQIGLLGAQTENIKADTLKKLADTELSKAEKYGKDLMNAKDKATMDEAIKGLKATYQEMFESLEAKRRENAIGDATYNAQIAYINQLPLNLLQDLFNAKATEEFTQKQIEKINADIKLLKAKAKNEENLFEFQKELERIKGEWKDYTSGGPISYLINAFMESITGLFGRENWFKPKN